MPDKPPAAESREAPPGLFPPFRSLFFLALIFLYLPFAYTYGFKLHAITFVDLSSFYYAAQTTFVRHQSPYAPGALAWGVQATHDPVWPFLYPPTLLLFSPFAHMSYRAAKLLVLVTNQLCVLALLFLLLHLLGLTALLRPQAAPDQEQDGDRFHPEERKPKELTAFFLLVYLFLFEPIAATLMAGQINLYVVVLLCLMWYALKKNASPLLSALPFTLAIIFKTYPLLFLPLLLLQGKWRMAWWTLGLTGLFFAGGALILPHSVWHDWRTLVLPFGGYAKTPPGLFSPASTWNQSVNGFASRLFLDPRTALLVSPGAARITAYSLCAALLGTAMFLTWRLSGIQKAARAQAAGAWGDTVLDLEFALFLLTQYLAAPLSWEHHLVFVLPAIFLALARILSCRTGWGETLWVAAPAFLIAWPIHLENAGWEAHFFHVFLSLKFMAVTALWLYFAARLFQILRNKEKSVSQTP